MAAFNVDKEVVVALRAAVHDCSERGLTVAAKWASELLLSISPNVRATAPPYSESLLAFHRPPSERSASPPATLSTPQKRGYAGADDAGPSEVVLPRHPHAPQLQPVSEQVRRQEAEWEELDADYLAVAKPFFAAKEYHRVVHWLQTCRSSKAQFLRVYSQFLADERNAARDWYKLQDKRDQPPMPVNESLRDLLEMVRNVTDPYLLFLKSVFLRRLSRREEAIECAILSLAGAPWNWSAWTALLDCLNDGEQLNSLLPTLPLSQNHPLVYMFQVKFMNMLNSPGDHELGLCDVLLSENCFPRSMWVMALRANVLYHIHDFHGAEAQYQKILAIDPYRIDDLDIYSNVLYVSENQPVLSRLAHDFLAVDHNRPEICCLIGNYHSLRSEHEKAVKYFRRATQLDRTYLSAWTLMGHEYIEMKNSHAAIEAYRKALEISQKDYRAWYGLGQAYELLSMHQYALHYYQHATTLRPYDLRIWQAQGICYEELGRPREAIQCLQRALAGAAPGETTVHAKLAKLYEEVDDHAQAAAYHRRIVETCRAAQKPITDYSKSAVQVARYHIVHGGNDFVLAKEYLEIIAASNAEEVTVAGEMLRRTLPSALARYRARLEGHTLSSRVSEEPSSEP